MDRLKLHAHHNIEKVYSGINDPTYITSYNNARSMIKRLERDEILEELVRFYVRNNEPRR